MMQFICCQLVNVICFFVVDVVEIVKFGYFGMFMGMVDIVEVFWNDYFCYNLSNLYWFNCDCFVLFNGYGLMLQYVLLYLSGYDLLIEQFKLFCQLGSYIVGYLECYEILGVEIIIGLLGQGFVNVVGFVLVEKLLVQCFNCLELEVVDYCIWVFMGDGCLMEGVLYEVVLLVGIWGLYKLVCFWDNNYIFIDGNVEGWFIDNILECFEVYGWNVICDVDGYDLDSIKVGIEVVLLQSDKLILICCCIIIGFGLLNKVGKEFSYGVLLGKDELEVICKQLGWEYGLFEILQVIYDGWCVNGVGILCQVEWEQLFDKYVSQYLVEVVELICCLYGELLVDFVVKVDVYIGQVVVEGLMIVLCKVLQLVIEVYVLLLLEIVGGLVDLVYFNLILWKGSKLVVSDDVNVNYVYYGVCEFGMIVIVNGLVLYGGFILFDVIFLVFSDYVCNGVCMSVLILVYVIYVYIYDLIGLGEDGLIYQLVEYLVLLCYILNNDVWCLCDVVELVVSWKVVIICQDGLSCLVFSCQNLLYQLCSVEQIVQIECGGYVLVDVVGVLDVILIVMGLEVLLVIEVKVQLDVVGIKICVVLMLFIDVFLCQDVVYCELVLLNVVCKCVVVEVGVIGFWCQFVGLDGVVIGIDIFGVLVLVDQLYKYFGIIMVYVVEVVKVL